MMVLSLFQWDKLNNHVALNLASTVHKHVAKGANWWPLGAPLQPFLFQNFILIFQNEIRFWRSSIKF